jgi:Nif11 domain
MEGRTKKAQKEFIMTIENADNLVKRLQTDAALKEKLQHAGSAGFEKFAADAGLPCSKQEFENSVKGFVVKQDLFAAGKGKFGAAASSIQAVGIGIV